jgi:hypothetical protein
MAQCPSGQITGRFTVAQLRHALHQLPASVNEYSSCSDVINRAILQDQSLRSGGAGVGAGGSFLPLAVIAVLAALVAAAAALGGLALRSRWTDHPGGAGP